MKKQLLSLFLVIIFIVSSVVMVNGGAAPIKVNIDGKEVTFPDAQPFMESGRVMVPVRFVTEALGGTVKWDSKTKKVNIAKSGNTVIMTIGSTVLNVLTKLNQDINDFNDSDITNNPKEGLAYKILQKVTSMDTKPIIRNNRTYVPLRFVSENLGSKVVWDSKTRTVFITMLKSTETAKTDFIEPKIRVEYNDCLDNPRYFTIVIDNAKEYKGKDYLIKFESTKYPQLNQFNQHWVKTTIFNWSEWKHPYGRNIFILYNEGYTLDKDANFKLKVGMEIPFCISVKKGDTVNKYYGSATVKYMEWKKEDRRIK